MEIGKTGGQLPQKVARFFHVHGAALQLLAEIGLCSFSSDVDEIPVPACNPSSRKNPNQVRMAQESGFPEAVKISGRSWLILIFEE
jgi:hypothetical protein